MGVGSIILELGDEKNLKVSERNEVREMK